MTRRHKIALIPGDGIGEEVTHEGVKILKKVHQYFGVDLVFFDFGAERYLRDGMTMPEEQIIEFRKNYDAILLGALGDPRIPDMAHARDILLGLRFKLDLFVNYRPVKLIDEALCPLKNKTVADIDFVVLRENTEGAYVGMGGIFKKGTPDEIATQEDVNTRKGVERIIRFAFEFARKTGRSKVTMTDKSNALRFGHDLWYRVFHQVGDAFPDIEQEHLFIDALVMKMVRQPESFDVIVTCNLFGDIISDLGAQLQGGIGLAASANLNPDAPGLFEPVHGSDPDIAGKGVANPLAAILTAGLLLENLGHQALNQRIEKAVSKAVLSGKTTPDLGGNLSTSEVGDFVCDNL
jgi:3-isopropylmalate dehydrogenase